MMKEFLGIRNKRKWKFQGAKLAELTDMLHNPARGWYQIHYFQADKEPDFDELEWCIDRKDSLALVFVDIGGFQDRELDGESLGRIRRILGFFRQNHFDIILRIAYDHEGKAMEREPFFFARVQEHLAQLCPVIQEYADSVFVYQGMLVGNWGEMHTSRFLDAGKLEKMADILQKGTQNKVYLAVRRPVYWRMLHPDSCMKEDFAQTRMGLYDDGILGSESHLGTFGIDTRENAGWDKPWSSAEELAFEERLCRYVPQGGEAVYEEPDGGNHTLKETVERLRLMRLTYLNRVHDAGILELWKKQIWKEAGVWNGVSGYDYIGAHMGYRFCVRNVSVAYIGRKAKCCKWEIRIENVGFANLYQEAEVYLEWRGGDKEGCMQEIECDARRWDPGEVQRIICYTEPLPGAVYLRARRRRDKAELQFANTGEGPGVFLGMLS